MKKSQLIACDLPRTVSRLSTTQKTARRIQVRRSTVHGKGVFALQPLAAGEKLIEYKGERITWDEAKNRPLQDPNNPFHTFLFELSDNMVIDGASQGNMARWINHSCEPNCQAVEENRRIFIYTLCPIEPQEELNYDYGLVLEQRHTCKIKAAYACHCGSKNCRGTMLARKRRA